MVYGPPEGELIVNEFLSKTEHKSNEKNHNMVFPFSKSNMRIFNWTIFLIYASSHVVGPRYPFRKDPDLDYDVDSDEEWEEVMFYFINIFPFFFPLQYAQFSWDIAKISNVYKFSSRRILVKASQIAIKMMKMKV